MRERGRTYLQACLLLLIAERPSHGYDLTARLTALGFADTELDAASTYRALRALEQDGSLASSWAPSDRGPSRRIYNLTGCGLRQLIEYGTELRSTQARMSGYLHRFDAVPRVVQDRHSGPGIRQPARAGEGGGR